MSVPKWSVIKATPNRDYTIDLVFADGQRKVFDATPLFDESFYAPLRKLPLFLAARVECGTVVWGDDLDIAPENLYEQSTVA